MPELCEADKALWNAFTDTVTPLKSSAAVATSPARHVIDNPSPIIPHTLDLHGLTVHKAYIETLAFIAAARNLYQTITIVTGRDGPIKREFAVWVDGHPLIKRMEKLNGGGAYRIQFKR